MADCPICNSKIMFYRYRWLTNVIGLTKPKVKCPNCQWTMRIKRVKELRGLDNIKYLIRKGRIDEDGNWIKKGGKGHGGKKGGKHKGHHKKKKK